MEVTLRSAGVCLCLWLTAISGLAPPAEAETAAYQRGRGGLERIGLESLQSQNLGVLHYDFQDFDFDADGVLWGISYQELYRLDPQSALPEEVGRFNAFPRIELIDLAVAPDGSIWVALVLPDILETSIYHLSRDTGEVIEVTQVDKKFQGVTFLGDDLIGFSFGQLYKIDTGAGTLEPTGLPFSGLRFGNLIHLASLGDRLFGVRLPVFSPPIHDIVELFPETGTSLTITPVIGAGLAVREETCTPSPTALCFGNGRFEVTSTWRDFAGVEGQGERLPWTSADSGLFQFFGADNWELLVKVLDGCAVNDRVWVLASASTNVEFSLTVRDTVSGDVQIYDNPLGNPAGAILDNQAFDACP